MHQAAIHRAPARQQPRHGSPIRQAEHLRPPAVWRWVTAPSLLLSELGASCAPSPTPSRKASVARLVARGWAGVAQCDSDCCSTGDTIVRDCCAAHYWARPSRERWALDSNRELAETIV